MAAEHGRVQGFNNARLMTFVIFVLIPAQADHSTRLSFYLALNLKIDKGRGNLCSRCF